MFFKDLFSSRNFLTVLIGLAVYSGVLIFNDGFMALDEYWVGIVRYIPAQTSALMSLVGPDDVKSPLQLLPMHLLAQGALQLGITAPYWQYRFVLTVLGALSFFVILFSFLKFSREAKLSAQGEKILLLMFFFYFAAPFALTRPMFETIAAPWLTLAAVYGYAYDRRGQLSDLLKGVVFVSLAFVLRQQLGVCALVFLLLPLLHKNMKHFAWASLLGLVFFIASGIPDLFIRGKFHFSLLNLTLYNYQHGAEYGQQGVWYYPALMFIIFFIPFFLARYPQGFVKSNMREYRSFGFIILLFVILHSLFPNKWERFLISIIPVSLILLFPFLQHLQKEFAQRRIRLTILYSLNGFLFLVASFFPAQKNLIEMSRYLDQHPEVTIVHRVSNTPEWITDAFILNKRYEFVESDLAQLKAENWRDCSRVFVVGEAQALEYAAVTDQLVEKAEFNVNLVEQWAFKLNPQKNLRRVRLKLYSGCRT